MANPEATSCSGGIYPLDPVEVGDVVYWWNPIDRTCHPWLIYDITEDAVMAQKVDKYGGGGMPVPLVHEWYHYHPDRTVI
jgi:hypothetical protein